MNNDNKFDLENYENLDYYIKDPIHKEINFRKDKWVFDFIKTKEFNRMKYISQLGISFKVFPSATNNRYMHSIGTFQVALKFAEALSENIDDYQRKLFLVSALLHDLGHGPFSHVFEKLTGIKHEKMTKTIILSKNLNIYKNLIKNGINPKDVIDVIDGKYKDDWINKLISSNIDVDRIDYMLRDSYFIGTNYSTIDINFLIERTRIINNQIYFTYSARNIIESFLLGRYYMHADIYDNKNTYIYEWSLGCIVSRIKEIKDTIIKFKDKIYYYNLYSFLIFDDFKNFPVEQYIELNDINFNAFLESLKYVNDNILNSFLDGFFNQTGIVALDYSKKKYITKYISKSNNIDKKYLFIEQWKNEKKIYFNDEKYKIKLIDTKTNTILELKSDKFLVFQETKNENLNKIILVNKKLII